MRSAFIPAKLRYFIYFYICGTKIVFCKFNSCAYNIIIAAHAEFVSIYPLKMRNAYAEPRSHFLNGYLFRRIAVYFGAEVLKCSLVIIFFSVFSPLRYARQLSPNL